jgi:hypothetical protein
MEPAWKKLYRTHEKENSNDLSVDAMMTPNKAANPALQLRPSHPTVQDWGAGVCGTRHEPWV